MCARLFIRNDDVWTLDRPFRYYFDLAQEHQIPVVHAVIPAKIDKETIRFLNRAKEKNPHLLDMVQHGWRHANYSMGSSKYEFGPKRSLKLQREDMNKGFKKMQDAFGQNFTPAFVPPYHGYDQSTLAVLKTAEFKVFSANKLSKLNLIDLPVQVSFRVTIKVKRPCIQSKR